MGERRRRRLCEHLLERLAVDLGEDGAQRLVAADDLRQRPAERRTVQPAGERDRRLQVVEQAAGLQPVDEPDALLRGGEGEAGAARRRLGVVRRVHLQGGRR